MDDFPGDHNPCRGDRCENHAASDVDVFGEQVREIIGAADDVGGEIRSDLCYDPGKADEEGSGASGRPVPF